MLPIGVNQKAFLIGSRHASAGLWALCTVRSGKTPSVSHFDVWRITNPDIHLHNLLEMLLRIVDVLATFF